MSEVCVDASVAAKLVMPKEGLRRQARQIFRDSAVANGTIIVPALFEYEVDSIIRYAELTGRLTRTEADTAFGEMDALDVLVCELSDPIRQRTRQIGRAFAQERVYDSSYAALAESRGCEFWTADRAFYEAVKSGLPFVKFLADYPLP